MDTLGASLVLAGLAAVTGAMGVMERRRHRERLRELRHRVHVNGSRGKSSVTRLIWAGLLAGGVRAMGKVTGTAPRWLMPDGSEIPIARLGRANIIEQTETVSRASDLGSEALIMECMALSPPLQRVSEEELLRATLLVLTAAGPDHLEVMGPSERDVACALAGTIPRGGAVVTNERAHLETYRAVCEARDSQLTALLDDDLQRVSDDELSRFAHLEHRENVALALEVCSRLGVERETALGGMWKARPDPGACRLLEVPRRQGPLIFLQGLAANDPRSCRVLAERARSLRPEASERWLLIHCRRDRPHRSAQLGSLCAELPGFDGVVVTGTGTRHLVVSSRNAGLAPERVERWGGLPADEICHRLLAIGDGPTMVLGFGNTGGGGLELAHCLEAAAEAR